MQDLSWRCLLALCLGTFLAVGCDGRLAGETGDPDREAFGWVSVPGTNCVCHSKRPDWCKCLDSSVEAPDAGGPVSSEPDSGPVSGEPDSGPVSGEPDSGPVSGEPDTGPVASEPDSGPVSSEPDAAPPSPDQAPSCTPTTCAAEGKDCGSISDGCGKQLACGSCSGNETCGGGGVANLCGAAPLPSVGSCLSSVQTVSLAKSSEVYYYFDTPGLGVDASGVSWLAPPEEKVLVRVYGSQTACFSGGAKGGIIDRGYPYDAVYECEPTHCPSSGCPSPCYPYHSAKAVYVRSASGTVIEDIWVRNSGDGIALGDTAGNVIVRRVYMDNIHDDALENDFGRVGFTLEDSLFESVFIAFAMRQAGSTDDQRNAVWEIRRNLIRFHAFPNSWSQYFGHSGLFKLNLSSNEPQFRLADNLFVLGPDMVSWGAVAPPVSQTKECSNNTILWLGTQSGWDKIRSGVSHPDGGNNGQRLDALNAKFGGSCLKVIIKPSTLSESDFLSQQGWTAKVAAWKTANVAGPNP